MNTRACSKIHTINTCVCATFFSAPKLSSITHKLTLCLNKLTDIATLPSVLAKERNFPGMLTDVPSSAMQVFSPSVSVSGWQNKTYYLLKRSLKVHGLISQNGDFYSNDATSTKKS